MRRIFFPLSKTAEPGPKKPHTFKMITPLPYRVRFFCARFTCARFLPATLSTPQLLSAPPCPHLAIKKPPGQTPKRFIKIHVCLRLFAAGSGTVGKTGADTKIRISVALVFWFHMARAAINRHHQRIGFPAQTLHIYIGAVPG